MTTCNPKLSQYSQAGGCACKLPSSALASILNQMDKPYAKDLLIDHTTADDCAVYRLSDSEYLLFTTDFFTSFVDDPQLFGAIAASHALSDIYAMGGTPIMANAILGYPEKEIPEQVMGEVAAAGQRTLQKHGCVLAGGHTISNPQPIYGFSIVGKVAKEQLKTNSGAQSGDILLLTKPIGSGILANALKLGLLIDAHYQILVDHLLEVNTAGQEMGTLSGVHAMTDVTGFGTVGHIKEMAEHSGLKAEISFTSIQLLPGTLDIAEAVISPDSGVVKNLKSLAACCTFSDRITLIERAILCDPQTNGGLLISASKEQAELLTARYSWPQIGKFLERKETEPYVIVR